ncbi:MAG TPA: bifunctional nuclease family protein [Myxococcota bacterium]|nr:bifunctional nuclease family protein [Myxococcota bacterium]
MRVKNRGLFVLLAAMSLSLPTGAPWAGPQSSLPATRALKPPAGFVEVTVVGVMDNKGAHAVVLKDESGTLLPIWIGDSEAFAIQLRLGRQRFGRPLTHDLLDKIMHELGGVLVKVQVDDLKNNTFLGTVFIRHSGKLLSFDARPSDSIALAVGNQAPIFISRKVLKQAGIKPDQKGQPEGKKTDPDGLLKDILGKDREEHTL